MQPRYRHERSVWLSVCLSNAWIVTKRNKLLPIFLYHMKVRCPSFCDTKNGWWRRPILPNILGQTDPPPSKMAICNLYSLITKKLQLSLIGSPLRFPVSLRWTSYTASNPTKVAQNAKWLFLVQKSISFKESLLQSFFVWKLSAAKL